MWDEERKQAEIERRKQQVETGVTVKKPLTTTTPSSIVEYVSQFAPNTPLDRKLEIAANIFVEHAVRESERMSPQQSMVSAAIAIEKMNLLRGLPTEIVATVPLLVKIGEKAAAEGISLKQILQAVLDKMR